MQRILSRNSTLSKLRPGGEDHDHHHERPSREELEVDWRRSHGANWRYWSAWWWLFLLAALVAPAAIAVTCDLAGAWNNMSSATDQLVEFPNDHLIAVPKLEVDVESLGAADASIVTWQKDMASLYRWILDSAPVDEVSDSTLDIEWNKPQGSPPQSTSVARDARVLVVHVFFACSAAVYFVDSIHLAVVLMQLNLIEVALALRIKALNDALHSALQQLWGAHMDFALLHMASDATALGQQQLCLQKLEVFYEAWERTRLGQTMRIPFSSRYMTLSLSVVFSLVLATTLRCLEIIVGGFYPQMPRFAVFRRIWQFIIAPLQREEAYVTAPPTRTSSMSWQKND